MTYMPTPPSNGGVFFNIIRHLMDFNYSVHKMF